MTQRLSFLFIFIVIASVLCAGPGSAPTESAPAAQGHVDPHASAAPAVPASPEAPKSTAPWWIWPLALFIVTFILGILAVLGGVA